MDQTEDPIDASDSADAAPSHVKPEGSRPKIHAKLGAGKFSTERGQPPRFNTKSKPASIDKVGPADQAKATVNFQKMLKVVEEPYKEPTVCQEEEVPASDHVECGSQASDDLPACSERIH